MNEKRGGPPDHDTDTTTGGRAGSQATFWTLAIAAVPVLYVLTLPPIMVAAFKLTGRPISARGNAWEEVYCAPYAWAATHTPLRDPLFSYLDWWVWISGLKTS